jgi:hypothetical protein
MEDHQMTTAGDWEKFCERASTLMHEALSDKGTFLHRSLHRRKSFGRVVDFFENADTRIAPDLASDILNLLMEVGGSGQKYFMELLSLFDSRASQNGIRRYFDEEYGQR